MTTTSIRVEVPHTLYEKLISVQKKHWQAIGRKPSLASIIIKYCENVLNDPESVHKNVHFEQKNVQNSVQNSTIKSDVIIPDANQERRFKQWEEYLTRWETLLREKESFLKEKKDEIFEEKEEIFQMRNELLEQKDKFRQETLACPEKIVENKLLAYELKHKNKKINDLEEELGEIKEKLLKTTIKPKVEKEEPTFIDKIKEYLPLILAGAGIIGAYLLSKNKEKQNLPPHLGKLKLIFDQLDSKDKESLGKILLDVADKHTTTEKDETTKTNTPNLLEDKKEPKAE